mgnify:CR=1 FL=1
MSRTLKLCIGGSTRRVNLFWSWWLTFKIDFEKKIQSLCGIWYYVLNKSPIILMTFGKTSYDGVLCKWQDIISDDTAPLFEQSFFSARIKFKHCMLWSFFWSGLNLVTRIRAQVHNSSGRKVIINLIFFKYMYFFCYFHSWKWRKKRCL